MPGRLQVLGRAAARGRRGGPAFMWAAERPAQSDKSPQVITSTTSTWNLWGGVGG